MTEPFVIDPAADIGSVALTVSDLARAERFYVDAIGFRVLGRADGRLTLSADGRTGLLELTEQPGARKTPRSTGLYHFAILLPSRPALAESLRHLIDEGHPPSGASDHGVSEALYLSDPDGNGIEIYRDRPRSDWVIEGGEVQMDTQPLRGLLDEPSRETPWQGLDPETVIGHIHLHVSDLEQANEFYTGVLGLEVTAHYGQQALFVSAGGYHHHIGLNTWNGVGAPPPAPGSVGLRHFAVELPTAEALQLELGRLEAKGVPVESVDGGFLVRDPSQNGILLTVKAP